MPCNRKIREMNLRHNNYKHITPRYKNYESRFVCSTNYSLLEFTTKINDYSEAFECFLSPH